MSKMVTVGQGIGVTGGDMGLAADLGTQVLKLLLQATEASKGLDGIDRSNCLL